jgi:hypothetical protein
MRGLTKKALAKVLAGHGRSRLAARDYECIGCGEHLRTNSRSAMAEHQAEAIIASADEEAQWFVRYIEEGTSAYGRVHESTEERALEWATDRPDLWEAVKRSRKVIATDWVTEVVKP